MGRRRQHRCRLPDELVEEILVRVPPSDPASLARAAVASKRWCRLVTGAGFRRRYRALHRVPPMLGFLCDPSNGDGDGDGFSAGFVPTSSFRPPRADHHRGLRPLDARHGRVLFLRSGHSNHPGGRAIYLLVWNPITGETVGLPRPPLYRYECPISWKAAVLCAIPAADCDHLDCHRGPFLVVLVTTYHGTIRNYVYSSEAAMWGWYFSFGSQWLMALSPADVRLAQGCSPLMGNTLYFMFGIHVFMYDWCKQHCCIDWCKQHCGIELPSLLSKLNRPPSAPKELITMGDGRLALAAVAESTLYIVLRDGELGWEEMKTIAFKNLHPLHTSPTATPHLVGFAEGSGLVFLRIGNEIFSLDIKSTRVTMPARLKKVYEGSGITSIVPYINFCTPVMGVLSTDDGPKAGASSDGQSCVASGLLSQGE